MALTRFVLKSRTTLPMSKLVQSSGRSGLSPAFRCARRSRGAWSGPRPWRETASLFPASANWLPLGSANGDDDELPVLDSRTARMAEAVLSSAATCSSPSAPSSSPSRVAGARYNSDCHDIILLLLLLLLLLVNHPFVCCDSQHL